ncbi:unnamed protein product, partial [Mesorhabditis belari]|uniref:Zinc-finger domain-containing protein n=1 Tax=Mesorhabditis belari TaxID=2138241 RepID=A0AAF3FH49_9BILA
MTRQRVSRWSTHWIMANGAVPNSTPPDGENFENATVVAHDRPEVEILEEPTNSPLEEGEIEDVSEDDRPTNSIQVIDGEDNIDKIIKEAYQDLPKVSTKVISTVAESRLESQHNGLLKELKRKDEYHRHRFPKKFESTSHRSQSRDTYRRARPSADSRFDRSSNSTSRHDGQMAKNYRQELSNEAISGRYSRASDRAANRDIDERFVLSPPPPAPLLLQMIPMPQTIQQQNCNKPMKQPLLPTPKPLDITMPGNPQSSYTSGANPIPPPQPRPSPQLYPVYQSLYGMPPYPLQSYPMQSTSQVSPYEYFPHNLPPPTLKQPQLSRTDAQSSWSLEVENFLSKKPAIQSTDNYEEVGMDLASPVSAVNVEEAEVVDGQSDQRTKQLDEDDDLEKLRKALLEQQQKTKTSRRQVVLSRDCSPISSRERKDRSADKFSRKSRSSTSRQLKELKKELADVRESIDDSEKKMDEYSHRYENLKKELQRTLTAIRTEQKNLQEHLEHQMELALKYEMMEINLKQSELTKKRRDKSLEQDCANELAVTNDIIRRCRNVDEKLRTKENNLALLTVTRQPSPPIEENGNEGLVPEKEVDVMKTSRKRLNVEKEAPVKPKMTRNEPAVVAPKPMVITTISSSSAETTLEENRANERPMLQLPQISTAKALTTALKTTVRKENPRSFPHKSAHLYAAANSYFPPTLPEPGYIARAERYKWTEVRTAGAYGIGLRVPPGTKQMPKQTSNEPFVDAQSVEKVVTPVQQKTTIEHVQVVVNQETEDRPRPQTSNEENDGDAIELSSNSEQQNTEESEHQMDENEALDEDALRQKLLARIKEGKMIVEPDRSAPLITSVAIDDEWEPEGAPQVVYEPRSPSYNMDDESPMENPLVVKPMQQEGLVNEPVSRNDDYRSQSPDYVPEGYVYEPISPNYGIDHTENEITSHPLNNIDERSESSRFENDSISQMQNGDKAAANRGHVEPNATLKRKTNLRRRSRGVENEPVEVPSTSVNTPNQLLNANVPLCSSELLYGQCIETNCRMQHFDNPAFAHREPEPPNEPKEKPKKKVPRVYHGEDAMVAEFVRGVFAGMPKVYPVGYIEAGITAMNKRWKAEKVRGNTFEEFKPIITKLIDQITKKQQKDDSAQKEPTAEKRTVLNKDPKLGVPDYVSRFNF